MIIFSLVLFIILFAPILFNKIRIPYLIGLIVAGIIVGPYGLNLLLRDSSIVLFGTVGLLYIMFLAGLEIDLVEFNKNKFKSLLFGFYTFAVPMTLGYFGSYYLLGFSVQTSVLLASMLSSHTLLAYPIASRYGVANNIAVTITVGGTMITDTAALLVLAVIVGMTKGNITPSFWMTLSISIVIFVLIILFLFPLIARWFFKRYEDNVSQYIFVLAMVFLGGFLAEAAGIEAIIGAFLTGLVLNKFIPQNSALMNRIGFVGNAIFIPFFLVGVGMLVDIRVFTNGFETIKAAAVMTAVVILAKIIAAWLATKTFRLTNDEGKIIFGLSVAQAAATLAVVLVGYNIILGETANGAPIRLLNEAVLNGSILTILITCTISSIVVERAAKKIVKAEDAAMEDVEEESNDKVLISISEPEAISDLVDLALMINIHKSKAELFALHVIAEQKEDGKNRKNGEKMMKTVSDEAAGSDVEIKPIIRFDANVSKGILYTIKEHNITDVIIGVTQTGTGKNKIGYTTAQILKSTNDTVFIHQSVQPFNTLKRIMVVVSPKAELEEGFAHWVGKIMIMSKESGLPLVIFAGDKTSSAIERLNQLTPKPVTVEYRMFDDWNDFLILIRELVPNDLFIIVSSRKGHLSYHPMLEKLSGYLTKYFTQNSYIIIYPRQVISYSKLEVLHHEEDNLLDVISGGKKVAGQAGSFISNLWKKKDKNDS